MYYVSDTAISARFPIYTRANVGEVFPAPVTPLTSTVGMWQSELGWRDAMVRMGAYDADEFPDDDACVLGVLGGYCYLNASVMRLVGERTPGMSWRDIDREYFGVQPGIPDYEESPGDVRPDLTEKLGETLQWGFTKTSLADLTDLTEHRELTKALRRDRPELSSLSDIDVWARGDAMIPIHRRMFSEHLFTSFMASIPMGTITQVAEAVGRLDLVMPIISGIGDVDSAAPSYAMWALSRLDRDSDEYRKRLEEFVHEFGSRGANEWEVRSATWETRPAIAEAAIDQMRRAPESANPELQLAQRAQQRAAASEELLALVEGDAETHGQLAAAIACSAAWLPARERTKTNNIRVINEMRIANREIGRRMVERGVFDEIEDFGFLLEDEYDDLCHGGSTAGVLDKVRERRAEYQALETKQPPFVFVGSDPGPSTWPIRGETTVDVVGVGDTIQGMSGCPGTAEGIARVVLDPGDPGALGPGEVLVAPMTDPSWTPLFVPAAAVVVDVGAALSHAIIVSRELGIPCVVSATDATRRIPDGARVRVDGSTGTVEVLAAPG